MSSTPAGWYADPLGRFDERYWDGFQWTARIRMGSSEGTDPMGIQRAADEDTGAAAAAAGDTASAFDPAPPGPAAGAPSLYPRAPVMPTVAGLAIASLVLGILWIYWIGSVLALVFGYVALSQIKRSNGWKTGRGMAIAGIVLGYVGIALLAVSIVFLAAVRTGTSHEIRFDDSHMNSDPSDGYCNQSRFVQDPDC